MPRLLRRLTSQILSNDVSSGLPVAVASIARVAVPNISADIGVARVGRSGRMTVRANEGQRGVEVGMARRARDIVRALQWEGVIEYRSLPSRRRVAVLAIRSKARGCVVG